MAVTFRVPPEAGAASVAILGEFTDWAAVPMTSNSDGGHEVTIDLPAGSSYRFRYLLDGARWANDWAADDYVANTYGSDDSVVIVEPADAAARVTDAKAHTNTTPTRTTTSKSPSKSTGKTSSGSTAKTPSKATGKSTSKSTSKTPSKTTTNATAKTKKADADTEPPTKRTAAKKAAGPGTPRSTTPPR